MSSPIIICVNNNRNSVETEVSKIAKRIFFIIILNNDDLDRYFIAYVKIRILDLSTIEKYDSQKMYNVYDKWPEIAKKSFESVQKPMYFDNIDHNKGVKYYYWSKKSPNVTI